MTSAADLNRRYQALLGWTAEDLGVPPPAEVGGDISEQIRTRQLELGVSADGVAGPATLSAALAQRQAQLLTTDYQTPEARLIAAGIAAVCEAKRCWLRNIVDLPAKTSPDYERCRSFIDELIRTPIGIDWDWEDPYLAGTDGRGTFEWCGTLPARAWGAAGLKLSLRRKYLASTYRIDRFLRYQRVDDMSSNPQPPTGPYRMIIDLGEFSKPEEAVFPDGTRPRPGDIALVGGVNTGPGKHITMIERFEPGNPYLWTIEGNGTGLGPRGNSQHGLVRAQRRIGLPPGTSQTFYFVRRIGRIAPADLI